MRTLGARLRTCDERKAHGIKARLGTLRAGEKHVDVREAIDEALTRDDAAKQDRNVGAAHEETLTREISALREQVRVLEAALAEAHREPPPTNEGPSAGGAVPGRVFRDRLKEGREGPEMVVIPAGAFVMGSPETEPERDKDEGPQHLVVFSQPFALGRYAVTFEEYDPFCKATGRSPLGDAGWGRGRWPVINVRWDDAVAYAAWLSKETGAWYRLPTEAEWEYAARAGTETAYWWGETIGRNRANCRGCGSAWDGNQTAPVGSFDANPFGLYDMLGNVWEWVQDCHHDRYKGAPGDGSAWETGKCTLRVLRGGSWALEPRRLRAALRNGRLPGDRDRYGGFRLARTLTL